jgi:xylulokinase
MPSNDALAVGIDVGTGGVRALVVSMNGTVVSQSSVPFETEVVRPQRGRHEQRPEIWWGAVCQATSKLVADLRDVGRSTEQLAAVSVDGTSGTVVALDAGGTPLRSALMYNDPRATEEAEELNHLAGPFCHKLGYQFKSSFALAKVLWIAKHEPQTFEKTARFAHQADYIGGRMSGELGVTDYSNALKTGYDLVEERWPDWIRSLPGVRERLPRVVPPATTIGSVSAEAAAATSLPPGIPVVAGATDGTAACLASGARRPGDYNTTLGTTLVFKGLSQRICRHPQGLIYCHKLPGGLWLPGAASNTGGEWIPTFFPDDDPQEMDTFAEPRLPGRYVAYPLVREGERFPFLSEFARGFCLPEPDSPEDRYAAYLVGVALVERLAYDVMEDVSGTSGGDVFSTGGGSRSDIWMQCRADALGRVVHRPACPESAFGSAVLAAAGAATDSVPHAIEEMVRIQKSFGPDPHKTEAYEGLFQQFREELEKRGYC